MPAIVFFSALLGILGVVVAFGARLARRASNIRRSFGDPQRFDPDARTGTQVVLEGRIRGAYVSSLSGLPAETAPADLAVEVEGTLLPIRGRAAVLAGSRETVPSRGRALRSVRPSDRVIVRGKIVRDAHGEGYRDGRTALVLEAFDDRGIVEIAYAKGPRPVRLGITRYAFGSLAGVVTGVVASFGALYTHQPTPQTPILADQPVSSVAPPACDDPDFDRAKFEALAVRNDDSKLTGRCALRRAEADLAAHFYHRAAAAILAYQAGLGEGPQDLERREALRCIADSLAMRSDGRDPEGPDPGTFVHGGRAMCRSVLADRLSGDARKIELGDGSWVWSDNQGMEFAKGPVARMTNVLLLELGKDTTPSSTGRYGFYPDAYLAKNDPGTVTPYAFKNFEDGADVVRLEWEGRKATDQLPFGIFADMVAHGRPTKDEPPTVRMYVRGNLAMFLAATGDIDSARAEFATLEDIPVDPSHAPYFTRPTIATIRSAIDELAQGATPFHMHGEMWSVLERNLLRAKTDPAAKEAVKRVRGVFLDRDIAVALSFLEVYARR